MKRRPSLKNARMGRAHLAVLIFVLATTALIHAQQSVEIASLRSEMKLRWQRSSPAAGETEGPVLYQLLFSAAGTPGTIARFDTNPRHLTNSAIVDNGSFVAIGNLAIDDSSGIIKFAPGQTLPGIGAIPGTGSDGQVLTADGSGGASWQTLRPALTNAWGLGGNTGTAAGTNHLGTNDNQPLELWVNGLRAYRLEPAAASPNVIGGFNGNTVFPGVKGAVIAGGGADLNFNRVTDDFGTVGGGALNWAGDGFGTTSDKAYATVSGGFHNLATGLESFVGGGFFNVANGDRSAIAGGNANFADNSASFVGGGEGNNATGIASFVGSGENNSATGTAASVGSGQNNTASGTSAFVGGGEGNTASGADDEFGSHSVAFVGGGQNNTASAHGAMVGGGASNTASGFLSAVVGGSFNVASGAGSAVVGGHANTASGSGSFAAGDHANTNNHAGAFVWGDGSSTSDVTATADDQFVARASGGVVFYSSSSLVTGVQLPAGGGSWSSISDRNVKDHFASVDTTALLAHALALPITTWNYKSQSSSIRHIGPMAQDFFAAFKVGEDDRHITEIDEGGVALAAIQGLNQKLEQELGQLRAELESKDAQLAAQRQQTDQLAVQLAAQIRFTEQFNSDLVRQQAAEQAELVSLREQITKLSEQARNTDHASVAENSKQEIAPPLAFSPAFK